MANYTTTRADEALWMSNGGEITCKQHGGSYLTAAIAAHPSGQRHTTPLDVWTQVTAADNAEWAALGMGAMVCESCARAARRSA